MYIFKTGKIYTVKASTGNLEILIFNYILSTSNLS